MTGCIVGWAHSKFGKHEGRFYFALEYCAGGSVEALRRRHGGRVPLPSALRIAADRGLRSIAFPAVGTGIAGFPVRDCAEIMLRECVEHLRGSTSLETIHFLLFDRATLDIFEHVWKEMRGSLETEAGA